MISSIHCKCIEIDVIKLSASDASDQPDSLSKLVSISKKAIFRAGASEWR